MIPNHSVFIAAIHEKKNVRIKMYSIADSGVVDRSFAPMDYGPGLNHDDGLNRYWVWDYATKAATHVLGLLPQEIVELRMLGESFDPAVFTERPIHWFTPRDWGFSS